MADRLGKDVETGLAGPRITINQRSSCPYPPFLVKTGVAPRLAQRDRNAGPSHSRAFNLRAPTGYLNSVVEEVWSLRSFLGGAPQKNEVPPTDRFVIHFMPLELIHWHLSEI